MKDFLIKWFVNIIALMASAHLIAGVNVSGWQATVTAALILGLLNAFLRPIIIILTLPLNIFSLGIFTLFINGFMFYLAAKFVPGFTVAGFKSAFWAAILFSIVSFTLNFLLRPRLGISIHSYGSGCSRAPKYTDVIDTEGREEKQEKK